MSKGRMKEGRELGRFWRSAPGTQVHFTDGETETQRGQGARPVLPDLPISWEKLENLDSDIFHFLNASNKQEKPADPDMAQRQPAALHWPGKVPLQCHPKSNSFGENHFPSTPCPSPSTPSCPVFGTDSERTESPPTWPPLPPLCQSILSTLPRCPRPRSPGPLHLPRRACSSRWHNYREKQQTKDINPSAAHSTERLRQTKGATASESLEDKQGPSTSPEFWKESQDPPPGARSQPHELQAAATAVFFVSICSSALRALVGGIPSTSRH